MNTPVSFELAKLLKEKGYRVLPDFKSSYPTIAEVVMWLYENHGIWIYPFRHDFNNEFYWHIDTSHEDEFTSDINFNSPTEAYEAAIEYTLKNLI